MKLNAIDIARAARGRLFPQTPMVLQTEAAECGLACIAMLAGRHGRALDLPGLRRRFNASLKGATLHDLSRLGGELGLATRGLRLELGDLPRLRLPCILHWNHNHFVVLTEVRARDVVILDPSFGRRTVPLDEVSRRFTGVALEAWPTERFEKKDERLRIGVFDLLRRTRGVGGAIAQAFALSALIELTVIAAPIGFQIVLDEAVVAADLDLLALIALGLGFLLALQAASTLARAWAMLQVGASLSLQWKVALFDQLMQLPLSFFERRHVGDVVSRFGSLDAARRTLTSNVVRAALDGAMSLALVVMMFAYGGALAIVPLVSVSLYAALRAVAYAPYRALSEQSLAHAATEQSHFMETARGVASVKVLNLEGRRRDGWINALISRVNAELRVEKLDALLSAAARLIFGVDRVLVIFLGARAAIAGELTVGVFIAFLAYKDQFAQRIDGLIDAAQQFVLLSLHGERIADIALADREDDAPALPASPVVVADVGGRLEARGLRFRYADNEPDVLRDLSFSVAPGECLGVAGPSGSGKTTLLKLLAGLARPTDGQIVVDGAPMGATGLAAYRARVGCVLQDDRLFAGAIADNIACFDPAPEMARIVECARLAAIHDDIARMPMGYETLVGDMGSSLSGGQRQRIVLARALYRRPSILLLDEATSHLDPANEEAINAAVKALPMTRIVIAHRPSTLAMTDRVLWLAPGD
ncbi:MAG: peptidase domain-containing ABC transporter [Rhizobiales bacterium]|nr:peptidase domain-containing ABC transporter [Hyphomicrobiales bacterium]